MASQLASSGPVPVAHPQSSPQQLQSALETSIWYILYLWPALHVAVRDSWGGPDSSDKKDWFAGAVSDYLESTPDHDDLVIFLLQIMQDEFDCNVEDESEENVAGDILAVVKSLMEGDLRVAKGWEQRYRERGQMKVQFQAVDGGNQEVDDEEEEWNGFSDDDSGGVDVQMSGDEAPQLVPAVKKERVEPEVDEDGFTKVIGKKKR